MLSKHVHWSCSCGRVIDSPLLHNIEPVLDKAFRLLVLGAVQTWTVACEGASHSALHGSKMFGDTSSIQWNPSIADTIGTNILSFIATCS